jgi:uncharacterized phage protein (TIGR01671 family)
MREIKFRAWDKEGLRMFDSTELRGIVDFFLEVERWNCVVMQYTGLLDKNGVEIYEGDVIATYNDEDKSSLLELDTWTKDDFGYAYVAISPDKGVSFQTKTMNWDWDNEESVYHIQFCEVIGNIWENGDLLDG